METENLKHLKSGSKKQRKELVDEAVERLAEIFIKQIEWEKNKKKRIYNEEKI